MENNFEQLIKMTSRFYRAQQVLRKLPPPLLLAVDFDGCLTDDSAYLSATGDEYVKVSRKDGLGASRLRLMGIEIVIISSETNQVVTTRAKKMRVKVIQGVSDKRSVLEEFASTRRIGLQDVWFLGNDVNDLEVMKRVPFALCPKDAAPEIRRIANFIIPVKGGSGVLNYLAQSLQK
jgi:N-acylneuraminate cytidylyltransferase